MSTALRPPRALREILPRQGGRRASPQAWAAGVVLAVVAVRLTYLPMPLANDEAGFLQLGGQWQPGASLYGDYWVDRPPLIIALFQLAAAAGGDTALHVLGIVAAAVTVWFLTLLVGDTFGDRAARVAAVVSGALLVSPLYGAHHVNGELLAAPFLAVGMWAAARVVQRPRVGVVAPAAGAGAAAALALLVKQNMADAVVFAAVLWTAAALSGRLTRPRLFTAVAAAGAGAVAASSVVFAWAWWHGTSPADVFWASYPFRLQAAEIIAESMAEASRARLGAFTLSMLATGVPGLVLVLALVAPRLVRERRFGSQPALPATVVTLVFAVLSVLAGGSYWLHYLVQTVPAVTLVTGAVVALVPGGSALAYTRRAFTAMVVVSSLVAAIVLVAFLRVDQSATVGRSIGASARPGDTLVFLFGDPQANVESGLPSPYEHLWSLPSRVLDPEMTQLTGLLRGPEAPTWVVVRGSGTQQRLVDGGAWSVIQDRYERAGEVCGRDVWLLATEQRPALSVVGECEGHPLATAVQLIP